MKSIVFCILIIFSGCSESTTSPSVQAPFDIWKSIAIHNYSIEQVRNCECLSAGRKVGIIVFADTVASITSIDGLHPQVTNGYFLTVNDLFAYIDSARARGADSIHVTYDKQYGFPSELYIDWNIQYVDDEVMYYTSNLQVIKR